MKDNEKISTMYSWPVIIIALCLFWPIGIFLIIRRLSIDKKATLSLGKIINYASIFSFVMAITGIILFFTEGFGLDNLLLGLFFAVAGVVFMNLAKKTKNEAKDIKQYLNIIINGELYQLDSIASAIGKPYEVVKKDIQKMINKGYLKNAYINEKARAIVLPKNKPNEPQTPIQNPINAPTKTITCPCCGANNTMIGTSGECEYCGSPLHE